MNYLKRATISVKRRPGKTIILLLLVLVLGTIISGATAIQQAVKNTEKNLRSQIPAVATLGEDYESMEAHEQETGKWPTYTYPTPDVMKKIGELPQVRYYDYSAASYLAGKDLKKYVDPESEMAEWWGEGEEVYVDVKGVHDPEILDIKQGLIKLNTGRVFTQQEVDNLTYVALISDKFAEINNLSIGSTFTLDNTIRDWQEEKDEPIIIASQTYEFEVIGIFEISKKLEIGDEWDNFYIQNEIENRVYVPNTVAEAAQTFEREQSAPLRKKWMEEAGEEWEEDIEQIYYQPVYVLNDPLELEAFKVAAEDLLPEFFSIEDMSDSYSAISVSMENMEWLASLVLWVAVGSTLLILSLLIILFLRDRKHEIGIYLALGEKKRKVITQIMLEVIVTAMIGMTASLFVGSLLSSNISESMLRKDLVKQQEEYMGYNYTFSRMGYASQMETDDMLESYDISLTLATILAFYGVGVGTILLSTIAPTIYITRLNPKKIMM